MPLHERLELGQGVVVAASVVAILGGLACSSQDKASSGTGGAPAGVGGGFLEGSGGAGEGGHADDGGLQGAPCSRVSDCASGFICGYKVSDGCSAQGECVPVWPQPGQVVCGALSLNCGCDGITTVYGGCNFFADYAPAPVMPAVFQCPTDAGLSSDGGSPCAGWGGNTLGDISCCDGLTYMPSGSNNLPGYCVKP